MQIRSPNAELRRVLTLPLLVFYGVGVTVGAGIFTLIAEITRLAGDHAHFSFIVAGIIAAFTSGSYALLASAYPRAAGEAIFVKHGIGFKAGHIVGYAVIVVAITTTAVISLGVSGYIQSLIGIPKWLSVFTLLILLSGIAVLGIRESVIVASLITLIEVGTLVVIIVVGLPFAMESPRLDAVLSWPTGFGEWSSILSGSFLAFFAYIGFEDIENLAEETQDAKRAIPIAIVLTLIISTTIYALISIIAASWPSREMFTSSHAPLADLFREATGTTGSFIAIMAIVAMTNGILVQIIMASRVVYGMATENMAPAWFKVLHDTRQTPVRAIIAISSIAGMFAIFVPMIQIAELTSLIILLIFSAVNLSLYLIGRRDDAPYRLKKWRHFGLSGATVSLCLVYFELAH